MTWYGLIDDATGDLVSVGTEAMFPNGDIANVPAGTMRHEFGETRPEFAAKLWNASLRRLEDRPAPVLKDRRDDLFELFQQNSDFMAVWNSLNTNRRNQLRTGTRDVLLTFLGAHVTRQENEPVEL